MKESYLFLPIYLMVFLVAFVATCKSQSIDQSKVDKIDALMSAYADYGKFNGSILVAQEGKPIYKKGFGFANMEWKIPNQTDTKFRLASVSKQFTAMLIMQLVADNKLALDVPISTYLPDYPKENGDKINIHHLLTHTSGIPNYTSFPNYRDILSKAIKPIEIVSLFKDSTLQFTPGEQFSYSNSGYALLGVIIEEITGKSVENVLQNKVLAPLKMNNTGFENNRNILKSLASGYNKNMGTFVKTDYIDMSIAFTAGGLYSTVEDLYLWDQALYTEKLLPNKYMDLVFDKQIPAWRQYYGYGWIIGEMNIGNTEERIKAIEHDGVINGFTSSVLRIPSDHSSILLLNNTGGAPLRKINEAILGILYDKTYDFPKKSLAHSLLDIIEKGGIVKGLQYYEEVKEDSNFYLDENELNIISYQLFQSDKAKEAADVLRLGIEAFPNAFNLYDSYGEILTALGDKEEAIKNYKKSLVLNPKNENGILMLKSLGIEIDRENLYLIKTDSNWTKEIFTFPLSFAKGINYKGLEEAHFPKEWRNQDSPEFWSYVFAWNINHTTELTETELENNLQIYFDGLMNVVNRDKDLVLPKTRATFTKEETVNDIPRFTGTLKIYDAFVTKESMILNVIAEKHYCEQKKECILLFRFSPKEFGHKIWQQLGEIKLRTNI